MMTGDRWRKKPVEIEAIQFTGDNGAEVVAFTGAAARIESAACFGEGPPYWIRIDTLEGSMVAGRNDWIIRGVQGEFYPCKPDIFAETYEKTSDETVARATEVLAGLLADIDPGALALAVAIVGAEGEDDRIREAKAEAWDEGVAAVMRVPASQWPHSSWRHLNPYRGGDDPC